jgi:hypothetical protein
MKIEELRLGQKLTVSPTYKYSEWHNQEVTICGLSYDRNGGDNICVTDEVDGESDGWKCEDFI